MTTLLVPPGTRRTANLPPLTGNIAAATERDQLYIFNVSNQEHWVENICGRRWFIPACPEGAQVSEPLVVPGILPLTDVASVDDNGMNVTLKYIFVDAKELAADIVGYAPFRDPRSDLRQYGIFVSDNPEPSRAEIESARSRWHDLCSERVREADSLYAVNNGQVALDNGKSVSNIGAHHRDAARILGVEAEHPWARKQVKLVTCDECGSGNLPTAAFCRECDNLLNEVAAKKKFPQKYAERFGGQPQGRKAKTDVSQEY
jgi:hypothetical protein